MGVIFRHGISHDGLWISRFPFGVRAVQEEFSLTSTGFMMSGYFVGYFIGAATIPNIISRVGHIRVFAAFASLASLVILVHSVLINPFIWFLLRVLTGISMVCIYTVAESWLNDRSNNKNRGSVLSIYMVILYGAMGIGMFLLNFSSPKKFSTVYISFCHYFCCINSNFID